MSLLLEGTLEDIRLADLLRLIAREQRTGALRVTIDGVSHRLVLSEGRLVAALVGEEAEPAPLEETVLALVRFRRGSFQLLPSDDTQPPADGVDGIHAEALAGKADMALIELEERLDAIGSEAGTPTRDAFPTPRQMEELDPATRTVYGLIDGERDLAEVILRSRLDPTQVLDALDGLAGDDLVKLDTPVEASESPPTPPRARRRLPLEGLSAALPLAALLAGLGFVSAQPDPPAPAPFDVQEDPLAAARAAFGVERLRAAVEAHRFVEGAWPARLEELAERGYVAREALADAQGRPYYYSAREDGFVLLAPER